MLETTCHGVTCAALRTKQLSTSATKWQNQKGATLGNIAHTQLVPARDDTSNKDLLTGHVKKVKHARIKISQASIFKWIIRLKCGITLKSNSVRRR